MKDILKKWQFWAAVVALVLIIVCVILYFTVPTFFYAASGCLIGLLAGFIAGYFVGKKYGVQ